MKLVDITNGITATAHGVYQKALEVCGEMQNAAYRGRPLEQHFNAQSMDALQKVTASAEHEPARGFPSVPVITEESGGRQHREDLFSRLMQSRLILVEGEVNPMMSSIISGSLFYLDFVSKTEAIRMHVNSPGGYVVEGMAIYDTMREISAPVHTYGFGQQASMGSVLLVSGDYRFVSPLSKIMVHQALGGAKGQVTDIAIQADDIQRTLERLKDIYVAHTGLKHAFWDMALERDTNLTAAQCVEMSFVDEISINSVKKAPFAQYAVREEFQKAREARVPGTAVAIREMLNTPNSPVYDSATIRPELVTALAKFSEYAVDGRESSLAARRQAYLDYRAARVPKGKGYNP